MTYFLIFLAVCLIWVFVWFVVLLHHDSTLRSPETIANSTNPTCTKATIHNYLNVNGRLLGILFLPSLLLLYLYTLYLIKRNMRLYPELYL